MNKVSRILLVVFFMAATFMVGAMVLPTLASAAEYVNASPAFTVTYGDEWKSKPTTGEADVLTRNHTDASRGFSISVADIPEGLKLEGHAKSYGEGLVASGIGSEFEIISNEATKTKDGSPAYFAETEWMYGGSTLITTGIMSAFKGGKWIYVHLWTLGALEDEEMDILNSLNFK
ncbi:MAG: hypothetical protein JRI95_02460 [Deltaproteobacteria bacterium]|nr:hypothetical protein [Deltaproteobacteria bacterium]